MPELLRGAEPLFEDVVCDVGESPVFDARDGRLWWVDVTGGTIFNGDLSSGAHAAIELPDAVGAIVPRASGGWVAASGRGLLSVSGDGHVADLGIVVEPQQGLRLNDAVAAPDGSMWVGSMAYDRTPDVASLYRVSPGGEVRAVLTGLTLSNGLEFTADGSLLPFVDSMAAGLDLLEIAGGEVRARRRIAEIPADDGLPDGLCLDTEGGVWVAVFGAGEVRRFTLDGACTHVVELPAAQPTSCCFAGSDLIVTTAAYGLDADGLAAQPLAGRVLRVATSFGGYAPRGYGG